MWKCHDDAEIIKKRAGSSCIRFTMFCWVAITTVAALRIWIADGAAMAESRGPATEAGGPAASIKRQNPFTMRFKIDELEVSWPNGSKQKFKGIHANRMIQIDEDQSEVLTVKTNEAAFKSP